MDPITHALSGVALARAIPKCHLPTRYLAYLILLTMASDADIVLRLFSETIYLQHHRGLTHSILLIPLWIWLIYSFSSSQIRANPTMPWLIGGALLLHICLDLITTFGTMLLAPFSDWRASLDLLFIIDPIFTASLLIPLLFGLIWKRQARKMGVVSLLLMCSYLGLTFNNQQQAIELARQAHPDAVSHHALPLAFSPYHWQLIARYPDHYARAAVNLNPDFSGTKMLFDNAFVTSLISSAINTSNQIQWQELAAMHTVQEATSLPGTDFYAWFARYPVLLSKDHETMRFADLAFGGGAPGVRPAFELHINLNEQNQAVRSWLIWRGDRKSEITHTSAPFNWLQ